VVASPLALLGAAPFVPAPSMLRSRVLDGIASGAPVEPVSFTHEGFAAPERGSHPRAMRWVPVAAIAVLLAAIVGLLATTGEDDTPVAAVGTTETTLETTTTVETTTTTAPTTTTTADVAAPTTQPEAPPSSTDPSVVPPPPPPDTTPPTIATVTSQHPEIYIATSTCMPTPKQTVITATVTGASSVTLRWTDTVPDGSKPMTATGNAWKATLGPFPQPTGGQITYTVDAVDAAGNHATKTGTVDLLPCAG
jgi:hypothetical protein